jgi:beta-lactamase superfamily II metal-dependent hydrolase
MRRLLILLFAIALAERPQAQPRPLDIYWVDVEGGAATLFVAPSGESMLIDTGFDVGDRDAARIAAAAKAAGLRRIDHVVISHYHTDHVGGLVALAKMIPLGRVYSPGDKIEPANQKWLDAVRATAGDRRTIVKPGDKVPLPGVEVQIVASDLALIERPLRGGGPNALCATAEEKAPAGFENQRMVGTHLRFGDFTFLALIDLDWQKEMELACPVNRLGSITLYQSGRHGSFDGAGAPALLNAIKPQVVVINNGPRKGLGQQDATAKVTTPAGRTVTPYERNAYARLMQIPGIEAVWQGHLALLDKAPGHNTSEDMIANMEETADCKGHWIKASVQPNGQFTVTNGRNGFTRTYKSRKN